MDIALGPTVLDMGRHFMKLGPSIMTKLELPIFVDIEYMQVALCLQCLKEKVKKNQMGKKPLHFKIL